MSGKNRIAIIDSLRGVAIIVVILTHVLSPFTSKNPTLYFLWDILHFAVPLFVFCSFYIFFTKYQSITNLSPVSYFVKRVKRLLLPYYIFLVFFFGVQVYFTKNLPSLKQVVENILVINGVDINWLVLLFIQLTIISLLILFLQSRKLFLWTFTLVSLIAPFVFLFYRAGFGAKHLHWISWSSVVLFTYMFVKNKSTLSFMKRAFFVSLLLFINLFLWRLAIGFPGGLFANKYPPDSYYLAYGITMTSFFYLLFQQKYMQRTSLQTTLYFFSKNSYELFFIHYMLLYIALKTSLVDKVPWYMIFFVVLIASSLSITLIGKVKATTLSFLPARK